MPAILGLSCDRHDEAFRKTGYEIPPFTLTDQDGKSFSSDSLRGKVWVAHFFYTTCAKGCSVTTENMRQLQERVRGRPDLMLVSISLNEETPEELRSFAQNLAADPKQWIFLRGPRKEVHALMRDSFHLYVEEFKERSQGERIEHYFKLCVVDRDGLFRGYVEGKDEHAAMQVQHAMGQVAGERYFLSKVNAGLNLLSGVLLILGYVAVRRTEITFHKVLMLSALASSTIFLGCYLYYHFMVGSVSFLGEGPVRYVYFAILLSHIILAAVVAPLAVTVAYLGIANKLPRHVWLARWTLPLWLYVSVTGVIVYLMLYQLYPPY
jgi:protein SCO1/2/putative membrane protein